MCLDKLKECEQKERLATRYLKLCKLQRKLARTLSEKIEAKRAEKAAGEALLAAYKDRVLAEWELEKEGVL